MDDLIELSATARLVIEEYIRNLQSVPEWLINTAEALQANIQTRTREADQKRLREIEIAEAQLLTATEKRDRLAAEKRALLEKLGKPAVA